MWVISQILLTGNQQNGKALAEMEDFRYPLCNTKGIMNGLVTLANKIQLNEAGEPKTLKQTFS